MRVTVESPDRDANIRASLAIVEWAQARGYRTVTRDHDSPSTFMDAEVDVVILEKLEQ